MEKHKKAIATDLGKAKPRDSVLLPLMKSTYREQQMFEVTSVAVILTNHPVLSRPAIVSSFPKFSQNSTLSESWQILYRDGADMQIYAILKLVGMKKLGVTTTWTKFTMKS